MRFTSMLLCTCMLLSVCAFPIGAAPAQDQVLMALDFEDYEIGKAPPYSAAGFTTGAVTEMGCIHAYDDGGNKVLKGFHGNPTAEGETARSPRLEKTLSLEGLSQFSVSYDMKISGGEATIGLGIYTSDGKSSLGKLQTPNDYTKWTNIRVDFDVNAGTAKIYTDGEVYESTRKVKFAGNEACRLRFTMQARLDGSYSMLDNVRITTPDMDYKMVDSSKHSTKPYNAADEEPESGDLLVLLDKDFEDDTPGKAVPYNAVGGFTSGAITDAGRFYVETDTDGNKMMKIYHGDPLGTPESRGPRIERSIPTRGLNTLTIDYDVKAGGENPSLGVSFVKSGTSGTLTKLSPPYVYDEWTHIKIRCDIPKKKAVVYVAGREFSSVTLKLGEDSTVRLRFSATVKPNDSFVAIDNVRITTPDKEIADMVHTDGVTVNWEKVKIPESEKTGLSAVMHKSHPRIFVTDWQPIKEKIATDANAKAWYDAIIRHAETQMVTEPTSYVRNARGNINDSSDNFKKNIIPVAAAYCLTGDTRYKDRVYQELVHVGSWPDWGSDEYLCTAHILYAYALCYDWLYNDFTPEQRAEIVGYIRDKGLNEAVLSYEGLIQATWIRTANNWNPVCNGSNFIAALAVADEMPEAAEYIYKQAASNIPYSFAEISPDGAYAEPIGYWDYGVRHIAKVLAALDSILIEGAVLPQCFDWVDTPGFANTCDFPIYYNGSTASFNYGDAGGTIICSPTMFWFANKYNKPQYAYYQISTRENNDFVSTLSGMNAVLSLLWYDPANAAAGDFPLDKFYSSTEEYGANGISMRSSWTDNNALIAMMHGGDATAAHANLDAGGFVLDWAGKRWVHMYGRTPGGTSAGTVYSWPNYQQKTLVGGRYQYYHTRAEANNTIIANPQENLPDMNYQFFAQLLKGESGTNTAYGIIDMTETNTDYEDAKRGMMLTGNRDVLIIQDEITSTKPSEFYWFANTNAEITISEDKKSVMLVIDGDRMLARITQGPKDATFGIMPAEPLPTSPNPEVQTKLAEHKLFIHTDGVQKLNLTVEFVPLAEGEGIPAPQPIVPLANWSVDSGEKLTSQVLGETVALKVDNPNAYAKGEKTYVDTNNLDIKPIVQNGRTLVPVRFISENIGATVSWDDLTQTIGIKTKTKEISLQLTSDQMFVDGQAITLDVPAQEIGGRTLIPLRALVEALGKQVFWDDRGLILITDAPVTYEAETIDKIIDLLDIRVQADGSEIKFFDSEVYDYTVEMPKGASVPTISVMSDKKAVVTQGNPATVTIDGKDYTFRFAENTFEGLWDTGSEGVAKRLRLSVSTDAPLPSYQSFVKIQSATSSIEWTQKYPMNGSFDNVIGAQTQNRWSANGAGHWICYDIGEVKSLHSIAIAGYNAKTRMYKYDIEVSTDGVNFTMVQPEAQTRTDADRTIFTLGDTLARYVRLTGRYAENTTWMGISEVRIYDSAQMQADDQAAWDTYFYESEVIGTVGTKLTLTLRGESKSGAAVEILASGIEYTSMDENVATVDVAGNVTLVGAGSTSIRAQYTQNGILKAVSIPVTAQ